ncbi:hypothetical protein BV20DRAFT_980856 [Pilatotrama ljubarskyi]|nr:hypothetical protein BV20DRAFT_980856 [Pilatotrama ljubarskyi]
MSSSETEASATQIIANHAFFFIEDCANFAEATLIFYEYFITFGSEVRLIWRRKITGASVLFFLNRYIMVFQNGITIASHWPMPDLVCRAHFYILPSSPAHTTALPAYICLRLPCQSCTALAWMDIVLNLLPYFIWNGLFFHVLRNRPSCGSFEYDIPSMNPDNMPPPYNCEVDNAMNRRKNSPLKLRVPVTPMTYVLTGAIPGDSIVLAMTWWKTYRLKRAADAAHVKTSIVDMLLRDGTIYFGPDVEFFTVRTMLALNVLHIMINHVEQVSFMGDIADVLTSILVSRFIMNLRDIDGKDTGQISRSGGTGDVDGVGIWHAGSGEDGWTASEQRGTIVFAHAGDFIDSMGGPLEHSMARLEDDESSVEGSEVGQVGNTIEGGVVSGKDGENESV